MSVPRRFNKPQGLKDIDVLIEDDAPISIYFNVVEVPEVITQGKSSFLIGGSNLLRPEVEIKFEITNDDSGAVIYTEPVANYLEGSSRRVSIEVYDDVDLFGDATLTIIGELNPQQTNVPTQFLDTYNVRYTRKIYISSAGVNTQPILFYNQPRIVVNEIVKPYITTTFPTGSVTKTGGVTGEPIPEDIGTTTNVKEIEEPSKFIKKQKNKLSNKMFGGGGNNAFVRRGRRRARRASPEIDKFTITNKSGDKFDARFVGGEIKIPNPQVDTSKFTLEPYHQVPTEYKSDVENVKNEDTLVPEKPFTIIDTRFAEDDPQRNVIVPLAQEDLSYTASFEPVPTQSISTVNFRSYADIRLSKLRTFSGDIDRVKLYARNKDAFGDFEVISDQQIESPELLFDTFGAGNQRVGYFLNQEHVNQYWVSSSNAVITQDSSFLLNAVEVSGSTIGVNDFVTFEQTGSLPISFNKDTEYNISLNAIGFVGTKNTIDNSTEQIGRAGIFISGSGFKVNHDFGDELGYQLEVNDQPAFLNVTIGNQQDFGTLTEIFRPQVDGNGVLKFVVFGGRFYISDVSINPATSTGFSPNFVQILAPVPPLTQERPDDYEFIAEFYDVNNNVAESIVFASASTFVGGNNYIAGTDNLLSGSMFIGSAIGGGIEMAGVNSGFIRSIGYEGFTSASNPSLGSPGFLMFSGSVLPNSGDDYKGVGLELVGGANTYFKFRTDPSELDIRTDSFFIGQESIQFISGSDGNIEISSSLFHLDPKNNLLKIGADAVIDADLTVNNIRTPSNIGGVPSTEQNASASISSQGFAAFRSASIGGFHVSDSHISSSGLLLSSTGQMTGSATLIGDKSAGQYLQFKDSTLTVQGDITANNIRTPATIGGAPSTDANASSSISSTGLATFKSASIGGFTISSTEISSSGLILKSSGQLTGSAVSMSGTITADAGRIAGWRIEGSVLSGSNATLDAAGAALYKSDQGPGSDTGAAFDQLRNEYYIDFTPTGSNSSNFYIKMGPSFGVDKDGVLFASGAVFEGSITASSGKIGGFSIETSSLSGTNIFISGSPLQGGVDDPKYMFISTSNFNVKENGDVTGSQVLFDGGKIGGFTLGEDGFSLGTNNINLDSTNKKITINNPTFGNQGIQLDFNSGTPRFYVGDGSNEFLKFDGSSVDLRTKRAFISGSQITLKSPDFFLGDTNNFISGSGGNLAIQALGTTTISGSAVNIATPKFFLGDNTNFISGSDGQLQIQATGTTTISGSAVNIQTPKFFMGGVSQFVSGSNGNIEISSSNFHLERTGDVTMAGTITATAGQIGGFGISSNSISSSNDNLILLSSGQITGSQVLFDGGTIGGFTIDSDEIKSGTNIGLNSATKAITINNTTFGNQGIQLEFNSGTPRAYIGNGSDRFFKFDGTDVEIQSRKFELDATNLELSSTQASMSLGEGKIILQGASTSTIKVADKFLISADGTDEFLAIGNKTSFTHFDQSTTGIIMGMDDTTPKFEIAKNSANYLSFDGTNFDIKLSQGLELDATNIEISSTNASMSLGEGKILLDGANGRVYVGSTSSKRIEIVGTAGQGYIATGKSSATDTTAGFWLANNNTDPEFVVGNSTNFIKFDGGDLDIASEKLEISASTIQISTAEASMSLGHSSTYPLGRLVMEGVGTPTFKMGPDVDIISMTTGSGIYMDGDGNFRFGDDDGHIKFQSGVFSITGSDVNINVDTIDIQTNAFELSSTHASMSLGTNRQWKASGGDANPFLSIGQSGNGVYGNSGLFLGYNSSTSRPRVSFVGSTSHLKFDSDLDIKTGTLELDATNIEISSTNASMSLGEGNLLLDGANSKIEVGSANKVTIQGGSTDNFITMGSKSSFTHFNQSTQGIIIGMDSTVPKLEMVGNATNYLSFDGTNFDIKLSEGLELDASNIELSSTHASMSLGEGKIKLIGGSTSTLTIGSSNSIKLSDDGTDRFLVIGSKSSFSHFDQSTAGFIVGTDGGTTKFELVGSATNYLSFDGTNFDVKLSQGLELDANNIEISSTHASMSLGSSNDINLDGVNKKITIGSANAVTIQGGGTDNFMVMGSKTSFTHFDKSTAGIIVGMDSTVPKFEIVGNSSNYLSFNGTNFDIALSQGLELDASNIELSSTHASMSIGDTNPIILQSIGSDRVLRFGSKTDFGQTTTAGFIMGIDNGVPKLDFTVGTGNDNFFRIDASGVDFSSDTITINTDRFKITSTAGNERIRFLSGSNSDAGRITGAGEFVRIGEISDDASDLYGLKIYDGTGTGSADTLVKLGQDGNEIAGWTITQDRLSGGQMIIRSDGTIESSGFASDVAGSGFRLSAENGGFLEVENAKIRGTMATAVFEKESVNAVGGQLYVANSTTLTGSSFPTALAGSGRTAGDYPANETTMSVENVSGFVQGEILSLKKVTNSGFSTEYVFVNSASRQNPSSENNFSGQLYVTRGYGSGTSGDSGSLGDQPSSAQAYSGSQVIVSTGRYISGNAPNTVGSGYIRMNANPADPATPYIDIIERTGSGIYDVELKARLGDLSGLSSGLLFGETNPGFGLFTENVFLKGAITAVTGSITGKLFVDTSSSQKMIFGIGVDGGSNDGIFINANNYWYTNGAFKVGSATYNLQNDSSGNITINPKTFELDATNIEISSTNASMSLGEGNVLLDGTNSLIQVGKHSANHVEIKGTNTQGYIRTGKSSVTDTTSGFWLANNNSDPEFSVGSSTNFLKYDGGTLSVQTQQLELAANTDDLQISSTHKSMSLAAGHVLLDGGGNVGYVRIGSNSTYDRNINISGSATQAIIKAGKTSFTDTTNAGFVLEKTNTDSRFFVGDSNSVNQIKFDTSGGVDIKTQKLEVDAGDIEISSTHNSMSLGEGKIKLVGASTSTITVGSSNSITISDDGTDRFVTVGKSNFSQFDQSTEGIIFGTDNGHAKFEVAADSSNYISFDGQANTLDIKASQFNLTGTSGLISLGTLSNADDVGDSSTGFRVDSSGNTLIKQGTANTGYIRFASGSVVMKTSDFFLGDSTNFISGSSGNLQIQALGTTTISGSDVNIATPKFFLGDNTNFISGSDGQLQIQATGTTTISGSAVNIQTPKFFMGGQSQFVSGSNGNIEISSSNFHLEPAGNVTMAGTITATAGQIGGFGISSNSISSSNNALIFLSSGQITASSAKLNGSDVDIDVEKFELDASNLELSSTHASMSLGEGKLILQGASTSTIKVADKFIISSDGTDEFLAIGDKTSFTHFNQSTAGVIMGRHGSTTKFEVVGNASNYLSFNGTAFDIKSQTFDLDASTMILKSESTGSIALGASPPSTYLTGTGFFVDGGGNLLVGSTSGNFLQFGASSGNLIIKSSVFSLFTSTAVIDSSVNNGKIALGSTPPTAYNSGNGVYLDGTGKALIGSTTGSRIQFDGGENLILSSSKFVLGNIGSNFVSASDGNLEISSSKFHLKNDGNVIMNQITASNANVSGKVTTDDITATGGTIGGFNIGTKLSAGSGGTQIALVPDTPAIYLGLKQSLTGNNDGVYISNQGISFSADENIFLSGSGYARIGDSDGHRIEFDGTDLIMSSSKFVLGSIGSNFVSASNGNLEISSSNFHLSSSGNVVMAGVVRASTGFIGGSTGWNITSGKMTSAGGGIAMDGNAEDIIVGSGANIVRISGTSTAAISAGALNPTSAPFQVDFGGAVTASAGQIAGFIMTEGALSSSTSTLIIDSTLDNGRGAIMGGSPIQTQPKSSNPDSGASGFFLGSTGFFVGNANSGFVRYASTGANQGISISGSNFSVSSSGDVEARNMTLKDDISFLTGSSNDQVATIGTLSVAGESYAGIDVGKGGSGALKGGIIVRSENQYEQIQIEGSSTRYGAPTTPQIALGMHQNDIDQGIIRYDHQDSSGQVAGLQLITYNYDHSDGQENAHDPDHPQEFVRIQHSDSGSITLVEDGLADHGANGGGLGSTNGGYVSIGSDYNETKQKTLGFAFLVESDSMINGDLSVFNGNGNGSLGVGGVLPSGTSGEIHASADIVAFATSDIRLKENITPIQDALFKVRQLQGIEFDWKEIPDKKKIHSHVGHDVGVIAHEVEKVLPEVVQERESGYKAVKYEKIVPLLIEAIKEQQVQMDEMKKEIEELKNGSTN